MKKWCQYLAVFLSASFILMGCTKEEIGTKESASPEDSKEMGRYAEDCYEENQDLSRIGDFVMRKDGTLEIFDHNSGFFTSADGGKTWSHKENSITDAIIGNAYSAKAAIAEDGSFVLSYTSYEDETDSYKYLYIGPEGKKKELLFPGRENINSSDFLSDFWFAPDGTLYTASLNNILYQVDIETSQLTELLVTDTGIQQVAFTEKSLLAFTTSEAIIYDRESNEIKEPDKTLNQFVSQIVGTQFLRYTGGNYTLYAKGSADDVLYLLCADGIYRHIIGGGTMEKLMEGTLYSYGDPTVAIWGMALKGDNEFLVQAGRSTSRFYYDKKIPAVPEKVLRVYGLQKNNTVQSAVSIFQKKHQDVYVLYETGASGEGSKTKEDAIKLLNMEIMAGNGPDVLDLTGLPMDSYREKGILLNLTDTLNQAKAKEAYFENVLGAYEKDGYTWAVPVQFQMPLMLGKEELLNQIDSLQSLTEAVKQIRTDNPQGTIIDTYEAEDTLRILALACASAWQTPDGDIAEDKITEFLTYAKEIYVQEKSGIGEADMEFYNEQKGMNTMDGKVEDYMMDIVYHSQSAVVNPQILVMGNLKDTGFSMDVLLAVKRKLENTSYQLLSGQSKNVCIPDLIAGVSSEAKETDLAKEFIATLISAENLEKNDGFPVNRQAIETLTKVPEGEEDIYGSISFVNSLEDMENGEESMVLNIYHMEEDDKKWLFGLISSLDTFYMQGGMLEEAVIETGCKVLDENMEILQAVSEIKEKLQLYMSE